MRRLAIYDMDRTITHAPTWGAFLVSTAMGRQPWRLALLPAAAIASAGYALRLIDRARLKQVSQRLLIGKSIAKADAEAAAACFADRIVAAGVFAGARAQIAADKAAECRLVMATASYGFYAAAIGARLGFDDVIATGVARDADGGVLARIEGENCYGPAKLRMIEAWLAGQRIARRDAHVRFYSDHLSDAPSLAWADEAFAVNAHGPLRTLARARGWTIVDWER
ncbi:MAG: HAD-IB family phosphatase [Pseudomonadota bacterium]|nr:HAD-IB family phosphatase [Pseudomonadota bacterium]